MVIAKRLGMMYLWIDCLCIIQDSQEDWQEQSASMGQVFFNSYCNIAAAHAADGTQGCFTDRNPALVTPLKLQLDWGPNPGAYYSVEWLFWRMNVLETPLNRRAWVCQERYLAPRNLYFGATQLYWECCELAACEGFPVQLPQRLGTSMPKGIIPHIDGARIRRASDMGDDVTLNVFSVWDRIVSMYTSGALTYAADKLVALSGMAFKVHEHTGCEYLAGLWRKHLAYQLLWQVRRLQWNVPRMRPLQYIAPSWSWASVTGRIEDACQIRFADDREIIIEILDAGVELDSRNPFGQVKSGFLRIRGSLAKDPVYLEERRTNRGSYRFLIDCVRAGEALVAIDTQTEDLAVHRDLYYLPIRRRKSRSTACLSGEHFAIPEISGIILQSTCTDRLYEFARFGRFDIFGTTNGFKRACQQFGGQVNINDSQDSEWGTQQTITLV